MVNTIFDDSSDCRGQEQKQQQQVTYYQTQEQVKQVYSMITVQ